MPIRGRLSPSQVTAVAATVAALAAVAVAVWDNVQQRQFYRISVTPRLEYTPQKRGLEGGSVTLTNEGVGPAEIRSIRIGFCDDDRSSSFASWNEARAAMRGLGLTVTGYYDLRESQVVGSGQSVEWLRFQNAAGGPPEDDPIQRFIDTFAFRIAYASIYDEDFRLERRPECLSPNREDGIIHLDPRTER